MFQRSLILLLALLMSGCLATSTVKKTRLALQQQELADRWYQQKNYPAAIEAYQDILRQYPAGPENWFRLGNCHARLQQRQQALAAYRQALEYKPEYSKAWHNLIYLEAQGLAGSVRSMLENIPEQDPVVVNVEVMLEDLLSRTQRLNPAVTTAAHLKKVSIEKKAADAESSITEPEAE